MLHLAVMFHALGAGFLLTVDNWDYCLSIVPSCNLIYTLWAILFNEIAYSCT